MKRNELIKELVKHTRYKREDLEECSLDELEVVAGMFLPIEHENKLEYVFKAVEELLFRNKSYKECINDYKNMDYSILYSLTLEQQEMFENGLMNCYKEKLERNNGDIMYFTREIRKLCEKLENEINFDEFIEMFDLNEETFEFENEVDRESSYFENIAMSSEKIGRLVRSGLIGAEEVVKDMVTN